MQLGFEQFAHEIEITASPQFAHRDFRSEYYIWEYNIKILNHRSNAVQLLSRHWEMCDVSGLCEIVEGEGVIGVQPVIKPGKLFEYTSSARLWSNSGIMYGYYTMSCVRSQEILQVDIPAFSLDTGAEHTIH